MKGLKGYFAHVELLSLLRFPCSVDPATESELDETDEQEPEEPEEPESMETNDAVVRLAQNSFDGFVKEKEHVLVMFAAPCKFPARNPGPVSQLAGFCFHKKEMILFSDGSPPVL